MREQSFGYHKVSSLWGPKCGFIVMVWTACVMITILCWMDMKEFQIIPQLGTSNPSFCALRPLSAKEAFEEAFILNSIAWPETPLMSFNYTFKNTTDPKCSKFTILPKVGGGQWYIGDQLEVAIIMKNYYCHRKTSGGDVILASLKNQDLQAGVSGQVVDHLNGSYTAVFPLVWEGISKVEVILVHPSESVTVLRRLTTEHPDRISFKSFFQSGSIKEYTKCNVCLRPTTQPLCNFTDGPTGEPWFCLKPKNLSCDTRLIHTNGGYFNKLRHMEDKLFKNNINMKVPIVASGSANVTVFQTKEQLMWNSRSAKFRTSGFYYRDMWHSLGSSQINQFNVTSIIQCLKGKVVQLYGDSTIRQLFEYLRKTLPDLKEAYLHNSRQSGPFRSQDQRNNIIVTYRCHAPPLRFTNIQIKHLSYVANEIDRIRGGVDTIIVVGVWSHFSTFPVQVYIRRLMSIRSAVLRLLERAPDTTVVIRSGNPKSLNTLYESLTNSDWFSLQRDNALRAVFKGVNVHLMNAWEMVLAHHLPHNLHPEPPIIKNMINVLLSYICPKQ